MPFGKAAGVRKCLSFPLALCFIESSTFHSSSCTRAGVRAVSCDSDVPAEKVRFYKAFCVFLCLHPAGTSTGRAVAHGTIPSPCASQQHKQSSFCPSTEGDVSSSPPLAWTQPSAAASPGAESSLSRSRYGAKSSANPLSSIWPPWLFLFFFSCLLCKQGKRSHTVCLSLPRSSLQVISNLVARYLTAFDQI